MLILRLALQSLFNRRLTAFLTVLSIAFSVVLLLGVEKVRTGARQSFTDTISGTDLIVGPRTGSLQLLLYSVFHIGNATNNITWKSYENILNFPEVAWAVPLSLGDTHKGFRVLGTTKEYFDFYRYRSGQKLLLKEGAIFQDLFDAVIGSDVAATLRYKIGDQIVVAHGLGSASTALHKDKPFRISGILKKTGTPVDRTVHVSLEAINAIHIDWKSGYRDPRQGVSAEDVREMDLRPTNITAALIGLKGKLSIFKVQRAINDYEEEPLSAIIPGASLQELWSIVGLAETALSIVSAMVVATALLGMITMIFSTLNERRREMAILRSCGARPSTILTLLAMEGGMLTLLGVFLGSLSLYALLVLLRERIDQTYGLYLTINHPQFEELINISGIIIAGFLAALLPAIRAYKISIADGMTVKT